MLFIFNKYSTTIQKSNTINYIYFSVSYHIIKENINVYIQPNLIQIVAANFRSNMLGMSLVLINWAYILFLSPLSILGSLSHVCFLSTTTWCLRVNEAELRNR